MPTQTPNRLSILLGQFRPSKFHEVTIANELQEWLCAHGIVSARNMTSKGKMPIGVRRPEDHLRLATNTVINSWHKDGLGGYEDFSKTINDDGTMRLDTDIVPSILWMILWSNGTPTEFMDKTGNCICFQPYDVVAINNHEVYHRRPPTEDGRWFARLADPILPASML